MINIFLRPKKCLKVTKNIFFQNMSKLHMLNILDLPDLRNGDQKSYTLFQDTHNVPSIPKRWGYNDEIPIKTAKILQNPYFGHSQPINLPGGDQISQGFQIGIICGVKMAKNHILVSICCQTKILTEKEKKEKEEKEEESCFLLV